MSKIEQVQNVTKSAEETSVELDREMSMNAELIGRFITQKVAVAMAEKTKQYEKKIKIWRKVKNIECRESRQKTVRVAVDAPPRKKPATQTTTKSRTPQKSASQSAQGRKTILGSPSMRITQKLGNADSGTPGNGQGKKSARLND